jgi:hypothetical protein
VVRWGHPLSWHRELLVVDCECNNTLVCTVVAPAQIFIFILEMITISKIILLSMENKIFENENEEFFGIFYIFQMESSYLFLYLFDRNVLKPPLYYRYSIT